MFNDVSYFFFIEGLQAIYPAPCWTTVLSRLLTNAFASRGRFLRPWLNDVTSRSINRPLRFFVYLTEKWGILKTNQIGWNSNLKTSPCTNKLTLATSSWYVWYLTRLGGCNPCQNIQSFHMRYLPFSIWTVSYCWFGKLSLFFVVVIYIAHK
jgi:hypothetical protein